MNKTAMEQQADAWMAVTDLLDVLVPDWYALSKTGQEGALQAIRGLAKKGKAQPDWWLVEHVAADPYVTKVKPALPTDPLAAVELTITPLYLEQVGSESKQIAITAMQSALSSHGRMLLTHPPKDAWDYNRVSEKLHNAISTLEKEI